MVIQAKRRKKAEDLKRPSVATGRACCRVCSEERWRAMGFQFRGTDMKKC